MIKEILKRPGAVIGLLLLLLQIVAIVFAPWIAPYSPVDADPLASLQPPSWAHLLGTDVSGMDIFSRIVFATRINLLISIVAVVAGIGTDLSRLPARRCARGVDRRRHCRRGALADPASPASLLNATDDPSSVQLRVGSGSTPRTSSLTSWSSADREYG